MSYQETNTQHSPLRWNIKFIHIKMVIDVTYSRTSKRVSENACMLREKEKSKELSRRSEKLSGRLQERSLGKLLEKSSPLVIPKSFRGVPRWFIGTKRDIIT